MSLGSIVVKLGMNTASFETDAGRAAKIAQRRAAEIDKAFKAAGVAVGVALVGGMALAANKIRSTISELDEMSKAAQRAQMPTEEFSKLAYAAGLADVPIGDLQGSLGKLAKSQAAAVNSGSEQAKIFDALGISVRNAAGELRPTSDLLMEFADRFKDAKDSPEMMAAGMALFGRSFQTLIPLLKDGSDGLRAAGVEAEKFGLVVSTEAGQQAEEFNDNLTRLQGAVNGAWVEIAVGMIPKLNEMTGELVAASKETGHLKDLGDGIATVMYGAGKAIGFVAGMVRQLAVDAAAAGDVMLGLQQAAMNVTTLGMAPGTVDAGLARAKNALRTRREIMDEAKRLAADAKVQADIDRALANATGQSTGYKLAPSKFAEESPDDIRERIRRAMEGAKKAAMTDEQRAAEALRREYESLTASMAERLALMGDTSERAKVLYDIEHGSLQKLDETRKAVLLKQAEEIDKQIEDNKLKEEGRRLMESLLEPYERVNEERQRAKELLEAGVISQEAYNRAITAHQTPAERMVEDLQRQSELLGKTREEQEKLIMLWNLGAEESTEMGRRAVDALDEYQKKSREVNEQIERMDAVRDTFRGLARDLADGVKPINALQRAFESLAQKLMDLAIDKMIEGIFGAMGSNGQGSAGGGWLAAFGKFLGGLFGGGRAAGGPVAGNRLYEVGEGNRPELFQTGNRTYLIPGNDGRVLPTFGGGAGGGVNVTTVVNINDSVASSSTHADQQAGKQLGEMVSARVKEILIRESRQGGLLWSMRT